MMIIATITRLASITEDRECIIFIKKSPEVVTVMLYEGYNAAYFDHYTVKTVLMCLSVLIQGRIQEGSFGG